MPAVLLDFPARRVRDLHLGKQVVGKPSETRFPARVLDYDGRPKPTMMAYSALEQQLDGAAAAGVDRRGGLTVHIFSKGPGAFAVVWSDRERALAIQGASMLDLMGNIMPKPVLRSGEPVFVVFPGLTPEELRARLR
jgi:hypothetical protein